MASSGKKVHYAHTPDLKWQKEGINAGFDVTFTPDGDIVVSDRPRKAEDRRVLLYSNTGELKADSKDQGVKFEDGPYGLTYDPKESAIIAVQGNCLLSLDPATLARKERFFLEDEEYARGVGRFC